MGRQPANTKIGETRVHKIRTRGGNFKLRALRLETGNFSWGSEAVTRKSRILGVVYNASNNELVRTNTLVKNSIIQVDATPFRLFYEQHYGISLAKKRAQPSGDGKDTKKAKSGGAAKGVAPKKVSAAGKKEAAPKKEGAKKEGAPKKEGAAGKKDAAPKKEGAKKEGAPKKEKKEAAPKKGAKKEAAPAQEGAPAEAAAPKKEGAKKEAAPKKEGAASKKAGSKKAAAPKKEGDAPKKEAAPKKEGEDPKKETKETKEKKLSTAILERQKSRTLDPHIESQIQAGKIYVCISSRPGQVGRCDGYVLEGKELEFYLKKLQKKKAK